MIPALSPFRNQLPVHSPLSASVCLRTARALLREDGEDLIHGLRALVQEAYSADRVTLCDSGTQALQVAIRTAQGIVGENALVALPCFACYDVGSAAVGADSRIRLYDLDPRTLAPDIRSVEAALVSGARIVVVAYLYGIPFDLDPVKQLLARFGAIAIEDAAQGHGGTWRGRPLGSLAPLSVLSFGRGKGWTGIRGGAVLCRGEAASARGAEESLLREARPGRGILLAGAVQYLLGHPGLYGLPASIPRLGLGETRFHAPEVPTRLSPAAAGLALATAETARAHAALRREHARHLAQCLAGTPVRTVEVPEAGEAGFLRFPVRVPNAPRAAAMLRRLGVVASYPRMLAQLPELSRSMVWQPRDWPGAETLVRELLTLPVHGLVSKGERERTAAALSLLCGGAPLSATGGRRPAPRTPSATARRGYSGGAG